ncbi:CheR family methyltransferase [Mastigocoleus testarum]|uniref:Chemotaxis protein n=1 Tax=Mastigocoleus testarum BC008 TaxID=371196 RepID=A0A0V7ZUI4_9CYAN|nr:protein-glutamate O-methyltransferase CheR [Mastigocoleus testarum]KST68304.1 chemotaxis protein [Mastigocoleus testarum BC008]KST68316.1 chemotaxis protein [Mastigocoleus testarum BC008]
MTQSLIEVLLKSKIGLDVNSINSGIVARAIAQRMADCGILEIESYLQRLQESNQEWEALVEGVIVPETWFFRERESFNFLKGYVISEWLPTQSQGVLRVLSIPCSTGEEPYSIVIALLEAGLAAANIHIDAVDISKNNLLAAQRGIYHNYSFRGNPPSFQERYFQGTEAGYQLCQQVRGMVNFMHGNLADPYFLVGVSPYDVIFCRNLLIYFDAATKKRTMRILERLLTKDGLLFLSHAETGLFLNTRFIPVRHPRVFAYRKSRVQRSDHAKTTKKPTSTHPGKRTTNKTPFLQVTQYKKQDIITKNTEKPSANSQANLLETSKTLANQGHLHEAAQLCNDYISQNPVSAEAYVLLGEVQQGMGNNEQAAQSLQKAIYLQPNCEEALTHLALLRENQGDVGSATLLWQRIRRLLKKR